MQNFTLLLFSFLITTTSTAHAYIDPGAGVFILQAIIAFFGVVVFYLGYPIKIIKSFFKKKDRNIDSKEVSKDKKSH